MIHAAEADHAEKVLDMIFVARDQSSEPLQPGKQPLDTPASLVASQPAPVPFMRPILVSVHPSLKHHRIDLVISESVGNARAGAVVDFGQFGREPKIPECPRCIGVHDANPLDSMRLVIATVAYGLNNYNFLQYSVPFVSSTMIV